MTHVKTFKDPLMPNQWFHYSIKLLQVVKIILERNNPLKTIVITNKKDIELGKQERKPEYSNPMNKIELDLKKELFQFMKTSKVSHLMFMKNKR
jgi:hypothetical protein